MIQSSEQVSEYETSGPRNKYDGYRVPLHIRPSNFKLAVDPSKPIIMVGPGTGVAPFHGFLQERAAQATAGLTVGKPVLFYGCRTRGEHFIYADDWEVIVFLFLVLTKAVALRNRLVVL
jgi:NADPH-ferrihemoprotein reductase